MRILFVGGYKSPEFLRWDGPQGVALGGLKKMPLLLRALLMAGHDVRVVSTALSARSRWKLQRRLAVSLEFTEGRVETIHAPTIGLKPFGSLLSWLTARLEAVKMARVWKPDAVYSYNCLLAETIIIDALYRKLRIPALVEIDDYPGSRSRGLKLKGSLDLWHWRRTEPLVSGFVLVNSALGSEFTIGQRPSIVIPGIVDELLISSIKDRPEPFCGRERTLVYCGGLSKERGADKLLAVIPNLPRRWRLVVAGSGPLASEFDRYAQKHPSKCTHLGFVSVEQMYAALCNADAVVNPPEQLTNANGVFPFKILEYLASGAHVISSTLPSVDDVSLKWIQRWNGEAEHLVCLLLRAESDYLLEASLRNATIQWVEANYRLRAVSAKLDNLLRTVASKNHLK